MKNLLARSKKRTRILAFLLAMLLCASIIPAGEVQAAKPTFNKKVTLRMFKGKKVGLNEYTYVNVPDGSGEISKVTSSNKKVVAIANVIGNGFELKPKKTGTAKVTFQYAKKKYTISVTVKNWENPCKSFKLGDKDYAKKFNVSGRYYLKSKTGKMKRKIDITPQKGWKISSIYVWGPGMVKNKSVVDISTGRYSDGDPSVAIYSYINVKFQNKKTGENREITLEFPHEGKSKNIFK